MSGSGGGGTLPRVCAPPSHPARLRGAPPAALLGALGVLRRPAGAQDSLPAEAGLLLGYAGVWERYVRLLGVLPDGTHVFGLPVLGFDPFSRAVCLRGVPARARAMLRRAARSRQGPQLSLLTISDDGSGESSSPGSGARAIAAGAAVTVRPSLFSAHTTVYGVVPDGVATVTVAIGAAVSPPSPVADNFFVTVVPVRVTRGRIPSVLITWRSASGATLKQVHWPQVLGALGPQGTSLSTGFGVALG